MVQEFDPGLVLAIVYPLLLVYPLWRIYGRCGLSSWFALIVFVPYIGLLGTVAILAFRRWPTFEGGPAASGAGEQGQSR